MPSDNCLTGTLELKPMPDIELEDFVLESKRKYAKEDDMKYDVKIKKNNYEDIVIPVENLTRPEMETLVEILVEHKKTVIVEKSRD